ncbi:transcriptional regulator [Streptomyces sp. DJ]|nr:transcriptional regulator [Streptomyces sp. DJ]
MDTEDEHARERADSPWQFAPDPVKDVVLDAKGLRALAHPVRVQLVGLLRTHGPSTATRLADRTGLTSGATSYHLRQLAAAGFVEEDAGRGNARERWWRAVHRSTWVAHAEMAEHEPEATTAYLQSVAAVYAQRTQQVLNEYPSLPRAWQEASDMSDVPLRLTPQETERLRDELRAVVGRYRRDTPEEAAGAPEGSERVSLITLVLPEPGIPAAGDGTGPGSGDGNGPEGEA